MAFIGNTNTTQAFTPAIDFFSGNGSTTAFTLSRPVASVAQIQVTIDNVAQNPSSAFTVSANTITFTSAPLSGTNNVYVYYTSPITQVIAPGQSTVGLTAFTATGTPSASTYLRGDNSWGAIATNAISNGTSNVTIASSNGAITAATNGTTALTIDTSQNVTLTKRATFAASSFDAIAASTGTMQGQTLYGGVLAGYGSSYDVMICNRNGSEALGVVANTQNVLAAGTLSVGGATPSTSGAGITFPATVNASSNANTLDDYEEGTWTATDASGAGLGNLGSGYYTKIGNYVFLAVYCTWPTTANGATGQIGGVPFAAVNTYYQGAIQSSGGGSPIISRMSGSTIIVYAAGNNGVSNASLSGAFVLISFGYLMS